MNAPDELLRRMRESDAPLPAACDVAAIYAGQLSVIAAKLTPEEMQRLELVGMMIHRRAVRRVPVLRADEIDEWVAGSRGARAPSVLRGRDL